MPSLPTPWLNTTPLQRTIPSDRVRTNRRGSSTDAALTTMVHKVFIDVTSIGKGHNPDPALSAISERACSRLAPACAHPGKRKLEQASRNLLLYFPTHRISWRYQTPAGRDLLELRPWRVLTAICRSCGIPKVCNHRFTHSSHWVLQVLGGRSASATGSSIALNN